jgi:hypothetical protein
MSLRSNPLTIFPHYEAFFCSCCAPLAATLGSRLLVDFQGRMK